MRRVTEESGLNQDRGPRRKFTAREEEPWGGWGPGRSWEWVDRGRGVRGGLLPQRNRAHKLSENTGR